MDSLGSAKGSETVELHLLGRFSVVIGGRELQLSDTSQRLLAILGVRTIPILRELAAGLLWPNADRQRARARLRTCLYRLNQSSDRLIARSERAIGLSPRVTVDYLLTTERARSLCDPAFEARTVELQPSLFEHELLPGWYDDWVVDEREAFEQLRFGALEGIARRSLALGLIDNAIQACLIVTRSEPLRESAHRLLAQAHAAGGNPAEALRQVERYATLIHLEGGTAPSPLMVDLRDHLLAASHR